MVLHFLWDGKKPKISKFALQNRIENGGLKLPNISCKIKSWQQSWIKRAALNPKSNWVKILDLFLGDITFTDLLYCNNAEEQISKLPSFYQDILKTWHSISEQENNQSNILNSSIWYNENITIESKPIFWKRWYKQGIKHVKDIINEDGSFITIERLNNEYNIQCNFLELLQLRLALPLKWREELKGYSDKNTLYELGIKSEDNGIFKPLSKIRSNFIYWKILEKGRTLKSPQAIHKWKEMNINFDEHQWKQIFELPSKICRNVKLQSFQYRVLNRIITCNHWLYNVKIKDSPLCKCGSDDTMEHFFITCPDCSNFWNSLIRWCENTIEIHYTWDPTDIMFGIGGSDPNIDALNFIIILAKKYIHDQKLGGNTICFLGFLPLLKFQLEMENLICIKQGKENLFELKWSYIYDNL